MEALSTGKRWFNFKSLFIIMNSLFFHPQTYKDFQVQRSIDCQPVNETYPVKVSDMRVTSVNESMVFYGKVEITEDLPMKIEAELKLIRCNIDGSGCTFFDRIILSKICEKMSVKTSIAYKIIRGVHPALTCPISKNTYEIMNESKFSLDIFKLLPLEGYLWRTRYIFYEKNGTKRTRPLACVECDVAVVTRTRRTKPKN